MGIGVKAQKGLNFSFTGLKASKFTVLYPREAKACASWLNAVLDPKDLNIKKLTVVLNCHAIAKSVERAHCIICHRETPSIDQPLSDIKVLEQGEKISFFDGNNEKILKNLRRWELVLN